MKTRFACIFLTSLVLLSIIFHFHLIYLLVFAEGHLDQ